MILFCVGVDRCSVKAKVKPDIPTEPPVHTIDHTYPSFSASNTAEISTCKMGILRVLKKDAPKF